LIGYEGRRIDSRAYLTPREQSVLRHASFGQTIQQTAKALGLVNRPSAVISRRLNQSLGPSIAHTPSLKRCGTS